MAHLVHRDRQSSHHVKHFQRNEDNIKDQLQIDYEGGQELDENDVKKFMEQYEQDVDLFEEGSLTDEELLDYVKTQCPSCPLFEGKEKIETSLDELEEKIKYLTIKQEKCPSVINFSKTDNMRLRLLKKLVSKSQTTPKN